MSLPARQQHALDDIELRLLAGDPRLTSMFATFTRLTAPEAMPATEAISVRLPRTAVLIGVIVTAVVGAVVAALLTAPAPCTRIPAGRVAAGPAAIGVTACHGRPAEDVPGGGPAR
jgi:hypothetical protein